MKKQNLSCRALLIRGLVLGLVLLGVSACANTNSSNANSTNNYSGGNTRMSEFKNFWAYCDGVPRRMEADYGRSVTSNRLEMMVTPPDAVDTKPALGLPPQAARSALEKYERSFKEKEQAPQKVQMLIQ